MNITANGRSVTVNAINLTSKTVTFTDEIDGTGSCPYTSEGDIPTTEEVITAIEVVLGVIEA